METDDIYAAVLADPAPAARERYRLELDEFIDLKLRQEAEMETAERGLAAARQSAVDAGVPAAEVGYTVIGALAGRVRRHRLANDDG
jgi:hypothetical protein